MSFEKAQQLLELATFVAGPAHGRDARRRGRTVRHLQANRTAHDARA